MYCKNCGKEMFDDAAICVNCGVNKGVGNSYCPHCGAAANEDANYCLSCGRTLNVSKTSYGGKSKLVAGLLGIFLGGWGIHNFYLGYTGKAVAQIILSFCFGIGAIWGFVEGILILCGNINTDADGNLLGD